MPMDESLKMQIEKELKDLPDKFRQEIKIKDQMYETVPSEKCPSGTKGRIAVFEMFEVDKEMQNVILKNPVDAEIYRVARSHGMLSMREDAIMKALDGIIPLQEAYNFNNQSD